MHTLLAAFAITDSGSTDEITEHIQKLPAGSPDITKEEDLSSMNFDVNFAPLACLSRPSNFTRGMTFFGGNGASSRPSLNFPIGSWKSRLNAQYGIVMLVIQICLCVLKNLELSPKWSSNVSIDAVCHM